MSSQIPPTRRDTASAAAPPDIAEQLDAALSIDDEFSRVQELVTLAPRLSEELLDRALGEATLISDEALRAEMLVELAPFFGGSQLERAYNLIPAINSPDIRMGALGRLYRLVPVQIQDQIKTQISTNPNRDGRLKGWMGMAEFLPSDKKQEAISVALSLANEQDRAAAFIALAPHVPDVSKLKFLKSARSITNPETKVWALSGLLPAMPKKERPNVLDEALSLAHELQSPLVKAESLHQLMPQVPAELKGEVFGELLATAIKIESLPERVRVLLDISAALPAGYEQVSFLQTLLMPGLQDVRDEKERGEAWIRLAQLGPPPLLSSILDEAKKIKDSRIKQRVIIQVQNLLESLPTRLEDDHADAGPGPAGDDGSAKGDSATSDPWSGEMEKAGAAPNAVGDASPDYDENVGDAAYFVPPKSGATEAPPDRDWGADADTSSEPPPVTEPTTPPPADSSPVRPAKRIRKKATKVAPPTAPSALEPDPPGESVGVKAYLHSDRWTLDDQLNYSLYAEAIAEFIRHGDTKPPLAIGILAPWGQGKTTLMKLIQHQLQLKAKAPEAPTPPTAPNPPVAGNVAPQTGVVAPPITPSVNFATNRRYQN
jgi:hypothetical protein